MLYLISTPIGHRSDISARAIKVLSESSLILCEDTRHSEPLLNHYKVSTPLKSYHMHNEAKVCEEIVPRLQAGESIALISDAGTPGISDPGERLVQRSIEEGIDVTHIPGACALITALVASGLPTTPFQFIGFTPRKSGEIEETLLKLLTYEGTSILYESPNRIAATIHKLAHLAPNRRAVIGRELTKKFESFYRATAEKLSKMIKGDQIPCRGEIVLLIEGEGCQCSSKWQALTPEEHVRFLLESYPLKESEAIKLAAQQRGVPKRDVYNQIKR